MEEKLKNYVCEICGGELKDMGEGHFQCPYCRTEFYKETTLPDELVLDLHSANRERSLQRFEDALNEYDRIISSYPDCFDAYWGATLSDYGIQYEKDYDGRMIPTVHRFSEISVFQNSYFVNAVKYCKNDSELARINVSAAEIEKIRADIKKTVGTQEPYDIFLCYKETPIDSAGGYTPEFYWADELYRRLRGEGYRVFFAKESLPASKGDYEAHIFPALKSAKLMLILTSSADNVNSVWVKNEWSRFIRFAKESPADGKRFKVIQSGFKPESLPRELRKEQVLNHDSMGWVEQLYTVIKDTFRDKKKEEEERRTREAEELEAMIAKSAEKRIKELEKKLQEEREMHSANNRTAENNTYSKDNSQTQTSYIEKQFDLGFYKGYAVGGVPNGKGEMTYTDGDVYEGEWKDGMRNGNGKHRYANGNIYEGEWKNGKINGKGRHCYANGSIYEGEWKDNKYNGKGKYTYATGEVYEGDFINGNRNGNGKLTKENGDVFEGEFANGNLHGKGKRTYKNGKVEEGEFINGTLAEKIILHLKYSSSPFSPASGSSYLIKFENREPVKIVSGKTDVIETVNLPNGPNTITVAIHGYNDTACVKNPVWTSSKQSFVVKSGVSTTIVITPGKFFTSPKITIENK